MGVIIIQGENSVLRNTYIPAAGNIGEIFLYEFSMNWEGSDFFG